MNLTTAPVATSTSTSRRALGVFQVAASGFCFGFLGIFGRLADSAGLSLGSLLTLRFLTASLILTFALALFKPALLRISRQQLVVCAGLGALGYAVFSTFYFTAINGVSVALASLLLYTFPALVALGAHWLFKEKLTRMQWIALPFVATGLIFLVGPGVEATSYLAVASGLASAVCYAVYILASSHYQRNINPLTSGLYVMLFAALALYLLHQPNPNQWAVLTGKQMAIVFGLAFVSTVLPMTLFLSGLQKLGNTETSLLSTIEPVTAAAMGAALLGEPLGIREVMGGALILLALVLTTLGRRA